MSMDAKHDVSIDVLAGDIVPEPSDVDTQLVPTLVAFGTLAATLGSMLETFTTISEHTGINSPWPWFAVLPIGAAGLCIAYKSLEHGFNMYAVNDADRNQVKETLGAFDGPAQQYDATYEILKLPGDPEEA